MAFSLTLSTGQTVSFDVPELDADTRASLGDASYAELAEQADALEDDGDLDGALDHYHLALAVAAEEADAARDDAEPMDGGLLRDVAALLYNRAGLRYDVDDLEGALDDLDASVALGPEAGVEGEDLADIYVRRADTRYALGDLDGAFADLDAALGAFPDHALAFNNRAVYHLEGEDTDAALADAQRSVDLAADDPLFLVTLGEVHAVRGDTGPALDALERAAALDDIRPLLDADTFDALRSEPRFKAVVQG